MSVNGFKVNNQTYKYNYNELDNLPEADYIAPVFSTSNNYTEGSYVVYNHKLYRFTTFHAAGAWSGTDVVAMPIESFFESLKYGVDIMPSISLGPVDYSGLRHVTKSGEVIWDPYTYSSGSFANAVVYNVNDASSLIKKGDHLFISTEFLEISEQDKANLLGYYDTDTSSWNNGKMLFDLFFMNNGSIASGSTDWGIPRDMSIDTNISQTYDSILMRIRVSNGTTINSKVRVKISVFLENTVISGVNHMTLLPHGTDLNDLRAKDNGYWILDNMSAYVNTPDELAGYAGVLCHNTIATITKQDIYAYSAKPLHFARNWLIGKNSNSIGTSSKWYSADMSNGVSLSSIGRDFNNAVGGSYLVDDGSGNVNGPYTAGDNIGLLLVYSVDTIRYQIHYSWNHNTIHTRHKFIDTDQSYSQWALNSGSGGTINNTFNSYSNTYNVTASPTITTDTNAYLAPSGNTNDRTSDIVTMLTSQGICRLGKGDYYVSNLVMPSGTSIVGCGKNTRIILSGSSDGFAIKMATNCTISRVFILGATSEITLSSTVGGRHGILWQGTYTDNGSAPYESMIDNVYICSFSGGGITCYDTGYGTVNGLLVTNAYIWNCNAGVNISYWSEFHKFTNVRTGYCYYGCINNGGNNIFVNCDFSSCKLAFLMDNENNQSPNNSHGSAIGCVFNHTDNNSGIGIKILNCDSGFIFDGCQIFFSQIYIVDSDGVVVSNSNFGNANCNITVSGGGAVLFNGNLHQAAPVITVTNNSNVHFVNCYVRSTGAVVA